MPAAFRTLYGLVLDAVRGAWLRQITSIAANRPVLGSSDLASFLFGSERSSLERFRAVLRDHQGGPFSVRSQWHRPRQASEIPAVGFYGAWRHHGGLDFEQPAGRLTRLEVEALNRSQIVTCSQKHRDPRFPPFAFTQHGATMAATILNSTRAVEMTVYVVRAFVQLRELLVSNTEPRELRVRRRNATAGEAFVQISRISRFIELWDLAESRDALGMSRTRQPPEDGVRLQLSESIRLVRGQRVILDSTLADLYGVTTRRLNEQVRRNRHRFPEDFLFELSAVELANLKSHFATSSWGGRRKPPLVFTEHGAIMAATILNSSRAVQMSVYVVRAFVRFREALASHASLARKLDALERSLMHANAQTQRQFREVYEAIRLLQSSTTRRRRIGFVQDPGEDD